MDALRDLNGGRGCTDGSQQVKAQYIATQEEAHTAAR